MLRNFPLKHSGESPVSSQREEAAKKIRRRQNWENEAVVFWKSMSYHAKQFCSFCPIVSQCFTALKLSSLTIVIHIFVTEAYFLTLDVSRLQEAPDFVDPARLQLPTPKPAHAM